MSTFDSIIKEYESYRPKYPKELISFIKSYCSLNAKSYCLDVGCGTGIFSSELVRISDHVYGLDPSEKMINVAKNKGIPVKFQCGVAESLPYDSDFFDFISFSHSFHWTDEDKALNEAYRVLKNNGYCAIFWYNPADKKTKHYIFIQEQIKEYNPSFNINAKNLDILSTLDYFDFKILKHKIFPFSISYTNNEYIGLLKSKSHIGEQMKKDDLDKFLNSVLDKLNELFPDKIIKEKYQIDLFLGQKRAISRS